MSLQMILIYIIGTFVLVYIVYKMYRIFSNKDPRRLCSGCTMSKECNKSKTLRDGCNLNGRPD